MSTDNASECVAHPIVNWYSGVVGDECSVHRTEHLWDEQAQIHGAHHLCGKHSVGMA
jgi:hypothetical protein